MCGPSQVEAVLSFGNLGMPDKIFVNDFSTLTSCEWKLGRSSACIFHVFSDEGGFTGEGIDNYRYPPASGSPTGIGDRLRSLGIDEHRILE